uniref:RGS domain-containing protein n=1 Tax=Parascaris univalens TaxID=6257 RepID=A0A915BZ47_PARUN
MSRGRKQSKHLSAFNGVESDASDSDVQVAHLSRRRQHRRLLTRQRVSTPQSRVASRARVSKVTAPTRRHTSPTDVQLQRSASDDGDCANNSLRYAQIVRTMGQCSYLSPQHRKFVTTTAGTYSKYFIDESLSSSIGECLEDVHRGRNYSSPYCHGSTGSGSLSETNSSSSRYVSGVSSCADSLSSCADTVIAPFALPLRETLIYECFLLSLGAVPATCIRAASSVVNRAIVTLRNQAIVARTVFMQIYYKVVIVYNKRYEITHRLMANDIFVAVTSAENRQLLGVIVNSPQKDHYICHVFGTDEQLLFHYAHEKYTKRYGIKCTRVRDGSMLFCNEFPHSAVTVVRNINYMQDSPRIEAPQRCITSQPTRYASRDLRYTHRILSSLSDVFESNSEATTTTGSQSFSMQRPSLSTVSSKAARRNSEVYNRIGVLPMTLIDSPLIQQKAVADLLGFSRRRNIRYKNIGERAMTEKRADLMIKHSSLNVMVINDEKEDANDGDLCDHECDDHVNAIASFSDGERSRHRKQIVSTDERGENAAAWPRPRGREVLANVAVEERILSQQCADRPVINPATQTLTATQQSDPHPSDLLKQSLLQSDHFVEDCSKKREDRVLEIKEYVEKREAGSKAPNTSNPPPLADTPNSTVTVQERVGEPECEPMANGEHTQASGLCSDRSSSDVERILHNPVYRRPFQQFLEQQFCAENINFYVAVEEYRSIPDNEMERRSKVARQIYERHFTANSIEPVNIDNSTSRCIRDAVMAQRFSAQLYDVAQYQIFHLLKYDCWPRYLRAGGVAPNFDDARGEDHPGPSTQPTQPSQQQSGDKKRKSLLWRGLKPRFSRRKKESRTTSSIQSYSNGGSPQTAETRSCGGVETDRHSPVERFASGGTPTAIVSSPLSVGGQIARVTFSGPPCSPQPCGSFDSVGDEQLGEVFSATDASMSTRMTWSGSKRRHRFTNLGKQFSVPAELSYGQRGTSARGSSSTSVSPNRSRQLTSEVCTRFCTLMHNEIASSEQIPLSDPTESVGKWTSVMAAKRGMDPRATEAVDAQSLSTIDPARQAMDALNNRCVCLVPVLHFAVEILAPNASTKTGSSNSRIVLLRTRHGLSSGVVLRSVLSKFSLDYDACVAVLSGTLEVIASHISVGTVGSRCITVMTQQQYQERQHSPKREIVKDALISAHLLSPDANVPFFQHGDVAFFELPPDFDPRTGKIN